MARLSPIRTKSGRAAGWSIAGVLVALVLIAGSVAGLDRHVLGHDEWASDDGNGSGVIVLAPDAVGVNQPGGSGRAEGGSHESARRDAQRETGGTVAPAPRRGALAERRPEEAGPVETVRVSVPLDPEPPSVARTLPGDRDGDGLTDRLEADLGTDPREEDTDGDALPDGWEEQYRLDPTHADDASEDVDGDGLPNRTEYRVRSNPRAFDTNNDGTPDGADDADGDQLPNAVEEALPGAEPDDPDTNGDGRGDGADDQDGDGVVNADEVAVGTNPGVPDTPVPPVDEEPVPAEEPAPIEEEPVPAEEPGPPAEPAPPAAPTSPVEPAAPAGDPAAVPAEPVPYDIDSSSSP